ncbi:UNVERIFIED_CONTAM: hypothetical protein FKN15_020722 [Acipenser sinensis]
MSFFPTGGSEVVKVHVQHPLEASVNIHQVERVREGPAQGQRQGQGDVIADRRAPVPRIQAQTIRGDSSYSESSGFGYCFQEVRNGQFSNGRRLKTITEWRYSYPYKKFLMAAQCAPRCLNGGLCERPHTCVCKPGFEGPRCETTSTSQGLSTPSPTSPPISPSSTTSSPGAVRAGRAHKEPERGPRTPSQTPKKHSTVRWHPLTPVLVPRLKEAQSVLQKKSSGSGGLPEKMTALLSKHVEAQRGKLLSAGLLVVKESSVKIVRTSQGEYTVYRTPAPARNQNTAGERIKVLFTPTICKVRCAGGCCTNHCERGNVTTVYSSERGYSPPGAGFRVFLCPLLCQNGGICMQKDHCLCPPNFTGKFCHVPVSSSTNEIEGVAQNRAASSNQQGLTQSVYTLPLHNHQSQQSGGSEVVKVHVQHPLEANVNIHQVERVTEGPAQGQRQGQGDVIADRRAPVPRIQAQTIRGDSSYSESSGFGYCFQEVRNGQCSSPLPGLRTQEICCRGQGKAWGISECALCPSNQEQFKDVCPAGPGYHYSASSVKINQDRQTAVVPPRDQTPPLSANVGNEREERPVQPLQPQHPVQPVRPVQTFTVSTTTRAATRAPGRCLKQRGGAYTCLCNQGYHISPQQTRCVDVDECSLSPRPCMNGQCENTAGSYRCLCPSGFRLGPQGASCTDIDECRQSPSPCTNARCENTPGSYRCVCAAGYQLDPQGAECTDINECENAVTCPGQECVNSAGSFQCVPCQPGYQLKNGRCTDIDECLGSLVCGTNGQCVNTDGSFSCDCKIGFRSDSSRRQCSDINECLEGDFCFPHGECLNTEGSYSCLCSEGYKATPDGGSCIDVDECTRPELCQDGSCTNTQGSFECVCQPGFATNPEKTACLDVEECAETRGAVCGPRRCENTIGSFHCITSCEPGHRATASGDCVDINECVNDTVCGDHAFCQNLIGSYQCLCDQGYEAGRNGRSCVDVNECDSMQGACGAARCENVEGSFLCICGQDSEEFDPRTGQCISRDGEAQRFPSSSGGVYRPDPSPPRSDVRECYYNIRDADVCQNVLTRNATLQECCCTVGEGWGENCQLTACPAPGTAEYQSVCPSGKGYLTSALGSFSYKDVDECTLFSSEVCKNGVCVNTIPGYSCYCPNGYYYDQTQLECVDENLAYCWQELGDGYICNRPLLDRQITYTECCCLYGLAWGIECALCPTRDSDDYEALCNVLRPPAYGPPVGPYAGEYGPDFGGDYEPPYGPDTFAEPPPRGRTPDYLRPGGFEDYPPRGGQVPSYGSRSRSPASYRPQEGPYGRRGPGRSYDLGDFESDLPYVPPESEPRPPFGRADSLIEPSYESRQGRYRSLSPQPVGSPFEPEEPSAPWLQYRPREAAPYPEYPDWPLGGIRRETYESRYESYEGLSAEECGILRGCENGRCIRVPEGYTCDCYDGYHLDMTTMTCIDINECDEADDPSTLCVNGQCLNTDGSYQCVCLRGFVMSRQHNYCIPARPRQ